MVWFWIALFNWRTRSSRVPRSNYLADGLVLFIKANAMDFYMRLDRMQIHAQVVYIFYDVSGINPFWMWKHGLRTQSSAITTAPASPVLSATSLLSHHLPLFWFQCTEYHIDVYMVLICHICSHRPTLILFWYREYLLCLISVKYLDLHNKEHNFQVARVIESPIV